MMLGYEDVTRLITHHGAVYILWLDSTVVYVGMSRNVYERLRAHKQAGKIEFNRAYLKWCFTEEEMVGLEYDLIYQFKPKHNKDMRPVRVNNAPSLGALDLAALGLRRKSEKGRSLLSPNKRPYQGDV
jgi:hypothetical protein